MSTPSATSPGSSRASAAEPPTPELILAELRRIARDELELDREIQLGDALVGDLQLDSMGLIVVAVGLENRFRVKLSEEDSADVTTVADLAALVIRRVTESV